MLREYLSNLANQFRRILGTKEIINAQDFADKINEVKIYGWSEGKQEGYNEGLEYGIGQGKQAAYDAFWDSAELNPDNGTVTYNYTFAGKLWNDLTFKPKYNIVGVGNIEGTFMNSFITDLKTILKRENKTMDFSGNNYISNLFRNSTITHMPAINFTSAVNLQYIFNGCSNLHTIDEFNIGEKVTYFYQLFNGCSALENVIFKGVLNANGFGVNSSPKLTKDSILSLLAILKDNSTTGTKNTVTLGATNLAKLTDAEKAIATQKGWTLA